MLKRSGRTGCSSTSFKCCKRRISLLILWALAAMPAKILQTLVSVLLRKNWSMLLQSSESLRTSIRISPHWHLPISSPHSLNARQNIADSCVRLAAVGLSRNSHAIIKSHFLCNHGVDFVNRLLVSVKKLQKRSLCSCRGQHGYYRYD